MEMTLKQAAAALKKELTTLYPDVKFSVKLSRGSSYGRVRVAWIDGPSEYAVNAVAEKYECASFDGMRDMMEYKKGPREAYCVFDSVGTDHTVTDYNAAKWRRALDILNGPSHGDKVLARYYVTEQIESRLSTFDVDLVEWVHECDFSAYPSLDDIVKEVEDPS